MSDYGVDSSREAPTGSISNNRMADGGLAIRAQPAEKGLHMFQFIAAATTLITVWIVVIGGIKLVEKILIPKLKEKREKQATQQAAATAIHERKEQLEDLTRSALLTAQSSIKPELRQQIEVLAKSKRINFNEIERMVEQNYGIPLTQLDDEDAEEVIADLEASKRR